MPAVPDGCPLTQRQWDVLVGAAIGETQAGTAERLGIAFSSVRTHRHQMRKKLGVNTSVQAVALAHEAGWLHVPDDWPTEWDPDASRVTASQRVYLDAFDARLEASKSGHDHLDRAHADRRLDVAFRALALEGEVPDRRGHSNRRPHYGMLDRLLTDVLLD